jgi:hypothetical protein
VKKIALSAGHIMLTNHGIYRQQIAAPTKRQHIAEEHGVFRFGVQQIFIALKFGDFLKKKPSERTKASQLEFHHRKLYERLIFSLQNLNRLMQELDAEYSRETLSMKIFPIALEAGCHADHILTYLSMIIDDIARVIILATEFPNYPRPNRKKPIDSMGLLKDEKDPTLAPVSALLNELNNPGSWWELAFRTKVGGRQLIIHNQSLVEFHGCSAGAQAHLIRPYGEGPSLDFFKLLSNIFANLFDWLERLESTMTAYLHTKSSNWHPKSISPECPYFRLPIGLPHGTTTLHPEYFVFPLCNGSDPLPWTVTVQ